MGWVRVGGSSWRAEGSDAQVIIFMVTLLISFTDRAVCHDGVTVFTSHATQADFFVRSRAGKFIAFQFQIWPFCVH